LTEAPVQDTIEDKSKICKTMISKDFKIDFVEKRIYHNPKGSKKIYTVNELYSFLQDAFDEPDNMDDDIPILAKSKTEFLLINGWVMGEDVIPYLTQGEISIMTKMPAKKTLTPGR